METLHKFSMDVHNFRKLKKTEKVIGNAVGMDNRHYNVIENKDGYRFAIPNCSDNDFKKLKTDMEKPVIIEQEIKDLFVEIRQLISGWNATEEQWSEWDKQVVDKISAMQLKLENSTNKIGSEELIGRVKERFDEVFRPDRRWNVWRGFYNGWIEGRTDLIKSIKTVDEKTIDALDLMMWANEKGWEICTVGSMAIPCFESCLTGKVIEYEELLNLYIESKKTEGK